MRSKSMMPLTLVSNTYSSSTKIISNLTKKSQILPTRSSQLTMNTIAKRQYGRTKSRNLRGKSNNFKTTFEIKKLLNTC